jgi:hypothetical protein
MKTDRIYTMFCRKTFTLPNGSKLERGTVFKACVRAYHSGALEFFSLSFPDSPELGTAEVPCLFARFHSADEPISKD